MSPALADGLLITGPLGKSKSGKPSGSLVMVVLMKILVQISALPLTGYVIMGNLFNLCFNVLICEIRKLNGVMVGINKLMNIKSVVSKFLAHT